MAPEVWSSHPCFEQIFKDSMCDDLAGPKSSITDEFAIVKMMKKVKQSNSLEYDYQIHKIDNGRPMSIIQMTLY